MRAIDPFRHVAILDDGTEMPFDLFLGIPKHRVPDVVAHSGMARAGWIPVDKTNLITQFPNVYAIGDVNGAGTPKAGVFAEGAAKVAADSIIADIRKWRATCRLIKEIEPVILNSEMNGLEKLMFIFSQDLVLREVIQKLQRNW